MTSMYNILEINDNVMLAQFHETSHDLHLDGVSYSKGICYGPLIQGRACHWSSHSAIQGFPVGKFQHMQHLSSVMGITNGNSFHMMAQLFHVQCSLEACRQGSSCQVNRFSRSLKHAHGLIQSFENFHSCSSKLGGVCSRNIQP